MADKEKYDKILVVNAGSSSLKFQLFSMATESMLCKGLVERIGTDKARMIYSPTGGAKLEKEVRAPNHTAAVKSVCAVLADPEVGVLKSLSEVGAIGHRVLHGGEDIKEPVICDDSNIKDIIRRDFELGPLHNPANLAGIEACEEIFPGVPNVAVMDTQFHQTIPRHAYLYAIPLKFYKEFHWRKYGFHGTSHNFVAHAAADYLGKPLEKTNVIICHLGNGSSICAVKDGKSFDTSMGLTPLPGMVMGTRCGDIDPAICILLMRKGYTADQIDEILNKQSGFKGINGIGSADMRDTIAAADEGNEDAKTALLMFAHRVALYIGGYYTLMGGADAVIFTGGIGENSHEGRKLIIERLKALGCFLDEKANDETHGKLATISTPESTLPAIVIPTNEELMIARETYRIVAK